MRTDRHIIDIGFVVTLLDYTFHESSGHLMDYNNSPQFKVAQSASKASPLFPEV